ncbi:hypothetical protein GN244_ATG01979 [Phytophthora infestans]|uniref:Uncharacterized protein n=1 Tax=Phytophthora infestans TaxID=4787 RepID=A0A833WMC3_PHYIN|nr:hypothetical protein GN244_ATG01979 [Phytophthora infestans]
MPGMMEVALEDWRLVSQHHESHVIELERVERGVGNSVVAFMNGAFTITEKTLHSAFPELKTASGGSKWSDLIEMLQGKRFG